MKVKELMELLSTSHPDAEVIMSSDGEGNSHSPLAGVWDGAYKAETTWSGEVGFLELTPELEAEGYGEDDVLADGVPAVILTPTN